MSDPLFWLALSLLLLAVSLTTVLLVAVPTLRELGRAARSAEKLFDTLDRHLPPTLEAIRLTGLEIGELTDDMTAGVRSASQVVKQVEESITVARQQAQTLHTGTRSAWVGLRAAWQTWLNQPENRSRRPAPRPKKLGHQRSALAPSHQITSGPPPTPTPPPQEPQGESSAIVDPWLP
ncbi:MAG: hypothetical protein KGQ93_08705 [Cyanobacteria bacterium REEB459]|nr:hypothetical protein [Cyanobacteria bacterium REEB459]